MHKGLIAAQSIVPSRKFTRSKTADIASHSWEPLQRLGTALLFVLSVACSHATNKPQPKAPVTPKEGNSSATPTPIRIADSDIPKADSKQFFYVFPTNVDPIVGEKVQNSSGPLSSEDTRNWCIRLRLQPLTSSDRKEFAKRVGVKDRFKEYLKLGWPEEQPHGAPTTAERSPSFVIDYDDSHFLKVWTTVVSKWGEHPEVDNLEAFVAGYIDVKTTTRRFDTASEVAKSHSGDCSEHATLLTALLRKSGKAARLVTGLLVIVEDKSVGAFGHAWTEWFEQGKWHIADAAMHPLPGQSGDALRVKRYIPVVRMLDEGPGFGATMGSVRSIEAVSGVDVFQCTSKAR